MSPGGGGGRGLDCIVGDLPDCAGLELGGGGGGADPPGRGTVGGLLKLFL